MSVAKQLVKDDATEGTVIIADEQTEGRGRLGRTWIAPPASNLLISIILYPKLAQLSQLNMVAALSVSQAVEKVTELSSSIKWPNDILIRGKKVSGILIENILEGREVKASIVGIGINVNFFPDLDITPTPTSLSGECGKELSREMVLQCFLEEFEHLYKLLDTGQIVYEKWLARVETLGKTIRVKWNDRIEVGCAESIEPDGTLIMRCPDGSIRRVVAGEVTLQV